MNFLKAQLKTLVKFMSTERVDYAVIGGVAVLAYGEPRFTADVDVNILLKKEEIRQFMRRARHYGIYPLSPKSEKIAKETGVIPLRFKKKDFIGRFDVVLAENILEYNAIKRSKIHKIDNVKIKLITPEDLVIHKMASPRPRDYEDLRGILARQRHRLDLKYIIFWLKKIDQTSPEAQLEKSFLQLFKEMISP